MGRNSKESRERLFLVLNGRDGDVEANPVEMRPRGIEGTGEA
jgi:hypothetical protein